jgi:hypothetical protein
MDVHHIPVPWLGSLDAPSELAWRRRLADALLPIVTHTCCVEGDDQGVSVTYQVPTHDELYETLFDAASEIDAHNGQVIKRVTTLTIREDWCAPCEDAGGWRRVRWTLVLEAGENGNVTQVTLTQEN